ncbi:ISL3 family transposase [Mycetohabitans rhizoxinica]|uniref:ISL3 family transposase n=1 Tax=Mycetohabitans rhizoxinica TaxID=412963 RepID=UPI0030CC1D9B
MRIVGWERIGNRLIVALKHQGLVAHCTACGVTSARIHGWYRRHVEDLPCSGHRVTLDIHVRRFRCDNTTCCRRTFAPCLAPFGARQQRRTARAQTVLWHVGLALSGAAGARLAQRLGMSISGETMLRLLKRSVQKHVATTSPPTIIGVDDWAFKRAHRYGTLLVDIEQRRPLDLLPDRDATSVANWLTRNRAIRIVSRDRAGVYAEGITRGAPQAIQVADRWHLLKNLGDAIERALSRCQRPIREVARSLDQEDASLALPAIKSNWPDVATTSRAKEQQAQRREARLARYESVMHHHQSGMAIRAIARITALDRRTVRHWINAGGFPERAQRPPAVSKLDPYRAYLAQRWHEGCQNATRLYWEIVSQGFNGGCGIVRQALQPWRQGCAITQQLRTAVLRAVPSTRRVGCWLMGRGAAALTDDNKRHVQRFVQRLAKQNPQIATIRRLSLEFTDMVKRRAHQALASWLRQAQASSVPEMQRFAAGIGHDYDAVHAALLTPYSNGIVEGHVNRLKFLKRQMYGRAGFQLLRTRVLNRC